METRSLSMLTAHCPGRPLRLGLKPALISPVGDEPMGRFVREPVPPVRGLVAGGSMLTGGAQA